MSGYDGNWYPKYRAAEDARLDAPMPGVTRFAGDGGVPKAHVATRYWNWKRDNQTEAGDAGDKMRSKKPQKDVAGLGLFEPELI